MVDVSRKARRTASTGMDFACLHCAEGVQAHVRAVPRSVLGRSINQFPQAGSIYT